MRRQGLGPSGARAGRLGWMEGAGSVLLVAGFVLMALGMFEIIGLLGVGVGLVAVLAGCLLVFWRIEEAGSSEENAVASTVPGAVTCDEYWRGARR